MNKGCCFSLEDIEYYTKAGTGKWCLTTNPSGKCCREYLQMIVNRYLKIAKKSVKVELEKIRSIINEPLKEVELEVNGMTCESCASAIRSIIEYHGGTDIFVNLEKNNAKCLIPVSKRPEELIERINESGFTARIKGIKCII